MYATPPSMVKLVQRVSYSFTLQNGATLSEDVAITTPVVAANSYAILQSANYEGSSNTNFQQYRVGVKVKDANNITFDSWSDYDTSAGTITLVALVVELWQPAEVMAVVSGGSASVTVVTVDTTRAQIIPAYAVHVGAFAGELPYFFDSTTVKFEDAAGGAVTPSAEGRWVVLQV